MKDIPKQVLAAASDCPHGHSCRETGRCGTRPMCPVKHADGENVLFLHDEAPAACGYRSCYGFSQVCRCPVRYHLHQRHGE